jgi:hypothetical protein
MDKFQEDNRILTQKELAALEKEVEEIQAELDWYLDMNLSNDNVAMLLNRLDIIIKRCDESLYWKKRAKFKVIK